MNMSTAVSFRDRETTSCSSHVAVRPPAGAWRVCACTRSTQSKRQTAPRAPNVTLRGAFPRRQHPQRFQQLSSFICHADSSISIGVPQELTLPEIRSDDVLIEAVDVHKSFGSRVVLAGVSLTIYKGEAVGIIGPSGCGKSTLLKLLAGLLAPDRVSTY